jgi:lipopolysaccharide biosynthesis glycosyltransferase
MTNVIYTAVDKNYENYARACFNSIKKNYPNHPLVLVYADDISDEFREYVEGLNRFKIKAPSKKITYDNLGPVQNSIVYQKYLLWDAVEFFEYATVLHLDCDTLVLAPLDDLFTDEFLIFDNDERTKDFTMFGSDLDFDLKNAKTFGNAGVFSIPRKHRLTKQFDVLNDLTNKYQDSIFYADQSIINLWCIDNGISVSKDVTYNFQPQFFSYSDCKFLLEDVKILHFAAKKPDTIEFMLWWRVKNGLTTLLHNMYMEYLDMDCE